VGPVRLIDFRDCAHFNSSAQYAGALRAFREFCPGANMQMASMSGCFHSELAVDLTTPYHARDTRQYSSDV